MNVTTDDVIAGFRRDPTAYGWGVELLVDEIEWMRERLFMIDRDWPRCGRYQAPPPPSVTFWLGADAA